MECAAGAVLFLSCLLNSGGKETEQREANAKNTSVIGVPNGGLCFLEITSKWFGGADERDAWKEGGGEVGAAPPANSFK